MTKNANYEIVKKKKAVYNMSVAPKKETITVYKQIAMVTHSCNLPGSDY